MTAEGLQRWFDSYTGHCTVTFATMSKSRTGNNSVSKTLIIYINTLHVLLNKCNYSLVKYFERTPKQPCAKLIFEFTCTLVL